MPVETYIREETQWRSLLTGLFVDPGDGPTVGPWSDLRVCPLPSGVLPGGPVDPTTPGGQQPVGQTGMTLIFSEEFNDGIEVVDAPEGMVRFREDGPVWGTWYPAEWPTFVAQDPGSNHTNTNDASYMALEQVSVDVGNLVLTSVRESTVPGLDYTSGMIQSRPSFAFTYGYAEVRVKVPFTPRGLWPAVWTLSENFGAGDPYNEIDFFEAYGDNFGYTAFNNVYVPGDSTVVPVEDEYESITDWHVYGLEWTTEGCRFYQDGVLIAEITDVVPNVESVLLLDLATTQSSSPTHEGAEMFVDYIRVWQ